jgi:hypothetical protein
VSCQLTRCARASPAARRRPDAAGGPERAQLRG